MNFLFKLILTALSVFALSKVLPGIELGEPKIKAALLFTLVFAVMNVTIKPILKLLTLPITCLTLGFFLLVINTAVVMFADYFVANFKIDTWVHAFYFSVLMSLASAAIEFLLTSETEDKHREFTQI